MFGGPAPRSASETSLLQRAGAPDEGIRSAAGDPATNTVDKGTATQAIVKAPESQSQTASASISRMDLLRRGYLAGGLLQDSRPGKIAKPG